MERIASGLIRILNEYDPEAKALIRGSSRYPGLSGTVLFYPFWNGTLVLLNVLGLPEENDPCSGRMYAFHIHEGNWCRGTTEEPFSQAGSHYNPQGCQHPAHAGDLPVLLSNHGFTLQAFYTDRFTPQEVIGRTAMIHADTDDYHTQPSGNAGMMIACGEIKTV